MELSSSYCLTTGFAQMYRSYSLRRNGSTLNFPRPENDGAICIKLSSPRDDRLNPTGS